ncbi:hypothetical protein [Micromonospora sp. KC606]|nr:hypothetical protein [Micromonospora sp. KC606]
MSNRAAYPSDLTDEQWAVVGPFLHGQFGLGCGELVGEGGDLLA